ncbi:hypothetical protein FNV43_RR23027 [Rhamnella rubrinervis]|uniref:B-like cyclin n=1 Tax=Rhamnella rubrinervis TaxID=2594499 RepID=A0A8K0DRJ4_9ROSA|nr:hypothetical protein FNV43_RR23027 [Rhamnella rubrinervis]
MQVMSLILCRLLQGFLIATPMKEPVDMSEGLAINIPKATPLSVILRPRLPHAIYHLQALASSFAAFLVFYKVWKTINGKKQNSSKGKKLPQPSGAWPLIGHLHLLATKGQVPLCRTLGALADQNGPIFLLKLGTKRAIVVSRWETVKECLCTNDQVFLTRPASATSKYMSYNEALFVFGPYGAYWRYVRKIASLQLLSNHRVELLKNVRSSEVDASIKELYKLLSSKHSAMVDMSWWTQILTLNITARMYLWYWGDEKVAADADEAQRFLKAMHGFMYLSGMFLPSDVIPGIEWMDLTGHIRSMKRNAEELDCFMTSWLEEHILEMKQGMVEEDHRDFMHTMISKMADDHDDNASIHGHATDLIIKGTALEFAKVGDIVYAIERDTFNLGTLIDTKPCPSAKNAQEELDIHVGRERWVEESDMKNLVYLQAIIKETLRLCPPAPLSVPHECMEDCYVAGHLVPKGTLLLVNVWKLHRDSRVWTDPMISGQRFLTSHAHVDVRGQNFEYIPFSAGRRSCPGISLAMQVIPLTLGRLLQGFDITTPVNEPAVDMTAGVGITLPKVTPVHVILRPRLAQAIKQLLDQEEVDVVRPLDKERGITLEDFKLIKMQMANYIWRLATQVKVRQRVVATAVTYMRRLYTRRSMTEYDPRLVAPTCLYLASKAEESTVQARLIVFYIKKLYSDEKYRYEIKDILEMEMKILEALDYYLVVYHPYRSLSQLLQDAGLNDISITQLTWGLINDTYKMDLLLVHPPHLIAVASIYIASVLRDKDTTAWFEELRVDMNVVKNISMEILDFYENHRMIPDERVTAALNKLSLR